MAVRHVVLFRFVEGVTPEQVAAIETGLATLPGLIPEIRDYRYGRDLGINDGNAEFGVVAEFASVDDYLAYRDHPEHRAVIARCIEPVVAERTALQMNA
jgi:Stress responsive A/B Barrel Domain